MNLNDFNNKEQFKQNMMNGLNAVGEHNLSLAACGINVAKNVVGLCIILYLLLNERILEVFSNSDDTIMQFFAGGMKVLLIAFTVCLAAGTAQGIITLVILIRGEENSGFGRVFVIITKTVIGSAGHIMLGVMGLLFAVMGVFTIIAPDDIKNGDPKMFTIVGAIFAAVGVIMLISAIAGIVKEVKYSLEDIANPAGPRSL